MKIAVILGYPAILADGALYWFGSSKYYPDEVAYLPTQVAHQLAVHVDPLADPKARGSSPQEVTWTA